MILEVHERMMLLTLLPKESDYAGLRSIRKAKEMLSFTPDEVEFYQIQTVDGKTQWNARKAGEAAKDVPIEEYIHGIFRTKLTEMDRSKKLTEEYYSVFEKFVNTYK